MRCLANIKKDIIFQAIMILAIMILDTSFLFSTNDCVEILANKNITNIIDRHAPQQTEIIASCHHAPNNALREAKRMRKRCERKYNKSKL